uniref:Uncharacterized protein n=1 Tax=Oryza sativa subsp. japonica TaxID=39947 RepID=Q6Z920_ORYSJ|nr:hypothetical protein [Oryza sativa Japonica Group]
MPRKGSSYTSDQAVTHSRLWQALKRHSLTSARGAGADTQAPHVSGTRGRAHGGLGPPRPGGTVDPDHGSGPRAANRAARGGLAGQPDKAAAHARTAAGDGSTTRRRTREAEGKREEGGLTVRRAARGDERGGELLGTTAGWRSRGDSTGGKRRTEAGMTSTGRRGLRR